MREKYCYDCGKKKSITEFSKYSNHNKYRKRCNECQSIHYSYLYAIKQNSEQNGRYIITMHTKYNRSISFIARVFQQTEQFIKDFLVSQNVYDISENKPCGYCGKVKSLSEFTGKNKKLLSGWCKDCVSEYDIKHRKGEYSERKKYLDKKYREENEEYYIDYMKSYYQKHKVELNKRSHEYHQENYEEKIKPWKQKYRKENPEKHIEWSLRYRLGREQATPLWADLEKIKEIYLERDRLTSETGIPHHVDHIIPLQGKNVCGLHVHNNLQILTETENKKKSNKFN